MARNEDKEAEVFRDQISLVLAPDRSLECLGLNLGLGCRPGIKQPDLFPFGYAAHSGISSNVSSSRVRPPAFGVLPPHCLKKNGTEAAAH